MTRKFFVALVLSALFLTGVQAETVVKTIAGLARAGYLDGVPSLFRNPEAMVMNSAGLIYIADRRNHKIRTLDTNNNNTVATLVGGAKGDVDGSFAIAQFDEPVEVVFDNDGNLIIADIKNHKIKKIDLTTSMVTTIAGSTQGYLDNVDPALAQFNNPHGLAVDSAGNIYVAEWSTHKIRKIDGTTAEVTTFAGSSSGFRNDVDPLQARFRRPVDLQFNADQSILFVAEDGNRRIRQINMATGEVSTYAGSGANGYLDSTDPLTARFRALRSIALDADGNIFVADSAGQKIRRIDADTKEVTTILGASGISGLFDGNKDEAHFRNPTGIVVNTKGEIFTSSRSAHVIRKIAEKEEPEENTVIVIVPGEPQNNPPSVVLVSDLRNQTNASGEFQIVPEQNIVLQAVAFDVEDGEFINNRIQWASNLDQFTITDTRLDTSSLSIGKHTITLSVKDSQGVKDSKDFVVNLVATVDELDLSDTRKEIIADDIEREINLSNLTGEIDVQIIAVDETKKRLKNFRRKGALRAFAWNFDSEETLLSSQNISEQIIWTSDVDGDIGRGGRIRLKKVLSLGEHTITATVANKSDTIRVSITLNEDGRKVIKQID